MGFTQIGINQHGYPQLEAQISRVLAGTVQRRERRCETLVRPGSRERKMDRLPRPMNLRGKTASGTPSRILQPANKPAYHKTPSFAITQADITAADQAEKVIMKAVKAAYNILATAINEYKTKRTDNYAKKEIPGYNDLINTNTTQGMLYGYAKWFRDFTIAFTNQNWPSNLATRFGTAVCEFTYSILDGTNSKWIPFMAVETSGATTLDNGTNLIIIFAGTRPDIRMALPTKGEAIWDITSDTAQANHTSPRGWQWINGVRYINEITYPGTTNSDLMSTQSLQLA
jgi:hypothetical protein